MSNRKKADLLKQMEEAHQVDDLRLYEELLEKILELGPHSAQERISLSDALFNLNRVTECLKILGKERSESEFQTITKGELGLQLELAMTLFHSGAYYIGRRILRKVDEAAKERGLGYNGPLLALPHYRACFYSLMGDLKEQEKEARFSTQHYTGKQEAYALASRRLLASALCGLKRYDEALAELAEIDASPARQLYGHHLETALYRHRALLGSGQLKPAKVVLKNLEIEFKQERAPYHQAFYYEELASYYEKIKDPKTHEFYRAALEGYIRAHQFQAALRVMTTINTHAPDLLRETEKLVLYHWPLYSSCKAKSDRHSYFINGRFSFCDYTEPIEGRLDLISGVILRDRKLMLLSNLQLKSLMAIIGSGPLGIGQVALADNVYRENSFDPSSTLDRMRKVIASLSELGITIKLHDKRHYFDFEQGPSILLPSSEFSVGPFNLLKLHSPQFKRQDVEKILGVSKVTAIRYIEEWTHLGQVRSQGTGRSMHYIFSIV